MLDSVLVLFCSGANGEFRAAMVQGEREVHRRVDAAVADFQLRSTGSGQTLCVVFYLLRPSTRWEP
jgi:hypothetical protein